MNLSAIRDAASAVIRDAVPDIRQMLRQAPELPPQVVPCCWFGDARANVQQGARSEWDYRLPLTCAVNRKGMIEDELAATEPLADLIERAFESHFTFDGLISGFHLAEFVQGGMKFGDQDYFGFTVFYRFKDRRSTTLSG